MMVHTNRCITETSLRSGLRDAWINHWPKFCTQCEGKGTCEWDEDPSCGVGSLGSGTMHFTESCAFCADMRKCPRCGERSLPDFSIGTCRLCSWNFDDELPSLWECYCWEDEMKHFEEQQRLMIENQSQ